MHDVIIEQNILEPNYHSVVYYHDTKPVWNEVVKVSVRTDQFAGSHLKFTFRHMSRDLKERPNPHAIAFLKLVDDFDSTALKDQTHVLGVYHIEKNFDSTNAKYLGLPEYKDKMDVKKAVKENYGYVVCVQ